MCDISVHVDLNDLYDLHYRWDQNVWLPLGMETGMPGYLKIFIVCPCHTLTHWEAFGLWCTSYLGGCLRAWALPFPALESPRRKKQQGGAVAQGKKLCFACKSAAAVLSRPGWTQGQVQ